MRKGLINNFLEVYAHRGFLSRALFLLFELWVLFDDDKIFNHNVGAGQVLFFPDFCPFAILQHNWAFVGLEACDRPWVAHQSHCVDPLPDSEVNREVVQIFIKLNI